MDAFFIACLLGGNFDYCKTKKMHRYVMFHVGKARAQEEVIKILDYIRDTQKFSHFQMSHCH